MRKSSFAVFSVILVLAICLGAVPSVFAEEMLGYTIVSGENGGSYLLTGDRVMVSGGEVAISGKSNVPVVITGNAKVILDGAEIDSASGAAISIDSGVEAEIVLAGVNKIFGNGNGAGIAVGYAGGDNMATLVISGEGRLDVKGGADGGAGIGGNGTKNVGAINGKIVINGGIITAVAQANGAGIGGGAGAEALLGREHKAGAIVINGGTISAAGNGGSAGIGGGNYIGAKIEINGGNLSDIQGGDYAAGIGGGSCSEDVSIKIDGGVFDSIYGYESDEEEALGGAVIGSGAKMCEGVDVKTKITVSDGEIKNAVAGWGAAGIGSGAGNEIASNVAVGQNAKITRIYTDGEKLPLEEGANVEGNLLQAVFSEPVDAGSKSNFEVVKYGDRSEAYEMELPKGYRAFATTVKTEADYSVRGANYYAEKTTSEEEHEEKIKLSVARGAVTAYDNLRPVEGEVFDIDNSDSDGDGLWTSAGVWIGGGMAIAAVMCLFVVYGRIL